MAYDRMGFAEFWQYSSVQLRKDTQRIFCPSVRPYTIYLPS